MHHSDTPSLNIVLYFYNQDFTINPLIIFFKFRKFNLLTENFFSTALGKLRNLKDE